MQSRQVLCVVIAATAVLLTACGSTPSYQKPAMEIPAAFREAHLFQPAQPNRAIPDEWWRLFGDETLNRLQAQLVNGNQNLRLAVAQYRAALP